MGDHNVCVEYSARIMKFTLVFVANVCVPGTLDYDALDKALDRTGHTSLWT